MLTTDWHCIALQAFGEKTSRYIKYANIANLLEKLFLFTSTVVPQDFCYHPSALLGTW